METVPLLDLGRDAQSQAASAAIESTPGTRELLPVEVLEDRVLLASDAAAAASPGLDGLPVEPAPYVAAQQAGHRVAVDLMDALEAAGPSTEAGGTPAAAATPGDQSGHTVPAHAEAELVDNKSEPPERSTPETSEAMEHASNRNEFGLATIEPEMVDGEATSFRDRIASKSLANTGGSEPAKADAPVPPMAGLEAEDPNGPRAVDTAVKAVADDLEPVLAQRKVTQPAVELTAGSEVASAKAATESPSDAQADPFVHTLLQAETPLGPAPPAAVAPVAGHGASAIEDASSAAVPAADLVPTNAAHPGDRHLLQRQNADLMNDTPPAAHDALFAGGKGVEAMLEHPSAPAVASP